MKLVATEAVMMVAVVLGRMGGLGGQVHGWSRMRGCWGQEGIVDGWEMGWWL